MWLQWLEPMTLALIPLVGPCALPIHPMTNWWRMRGHKSFIAFDHRPSPLVLEWIVKSLTTRMLEKWLLAMLRWWLVVNVPIDGWQCWNKWWLGLAKPNDGWRWASGFDTMLKEQEKERAKENSIYKTVQVEAYTYRHTYGWSTRNWSVVQVIIMGLSLWCIGLQTN